MKFLQEMAHSIGMEASWVDDSSLPIESRTSADYNPSKSMKEEKQHNLCDNLHSPIQTRDEEIKCLVAKISEMTEKMSMILFRQQATMIGTRHSAPPILKSWMLSLWNHKKPN